LYQAVCTNMMAEDYNVQGSAADATTAI
jgi:hypothetical protein